MAAAVTLAAVGVACGGDDEVASGGGERSTSTPAATAGPAADSVLTLDLKGLEPVAPAHYEGWAIRGNEKISTGKFGVAADGSLASLSGQRLTSFAVGRDIAGAEQIVITIEPAGDADAVPSGIAVLAGRIADGRAALAFPAELRGIAGGYLLATPTDDPQDTANDSAGVWFVALGPLRAALMLPALPDGWVYEGWAVTQKTPLSTGRFRTAGGADASAAFSGPTSGPAFPGEDFVRGLPAGITSPVNLAEGASTIVVSVEPDLGGVDPTGAGPFAIKPLAGVVPAGLTDHILTALAPDLASLPTGTAIVRKS